MNKKKEKKFITKKVEDLHITNDITYKRKFEMIKNNKPIVIDQQINIYLVSLRLNQNGCLKLKEEKVIN
jgi:hypothetical protein